MSAGDLLDIRKFVAPGFGENAYLARCRGDDAVVAIDPGGAVPQMALVIEEWGGSLDAIYLTHAHYDHIEGVQRLSARFPAPIHLHDADRPLYEHAAQQAAMFGLAPLDLPPIDASIVPGQELVFGACRFDVRHVPGHSPGHVMLYSPEAGLAFVGDVVFQGSIGRSDLPGGDFATLMQSIRHHVLSLPDETVLHPGHGAATTVGHERKSNPFLVPQFGGGLA